MRLRLLLVCCLVLCFTAGCGTRAIPPAQVAATSNPLVALFTVTPGYAAKVTVQFGPTTGYGYATAAVSTPAADASGAVRVEVAGMRARTVYHLRAQIAYAHGRTVTTADQVFTTGSLPADLAAVKLTAVTAPGRHPQPGIELVDPTILLTGGTARPYATDLAGHILWYYPWTDFPGKPYLVNGIRLLSNGHFLAVLSPTSSAYLNKVKVDPAKVYIREFDLIGNTVRQLTLSDLNARLAARGYRNQAGTPLVLQDFHHDIVPLPNGHWLILASTLAPRTIHNASVIVQGDVIVDLDPNLRPVWLWNTFDHMDPTREPMKFPDWTHSNAIVYSPADGNLLVSMRHQSWIVKIAYRNGTGDGSILWRLGYQGDFTLLRNGAPDPNPYDWPYAQHGPSFVGPATAGVFNLVLMDNGNDRIVPGNVKNCPTGRSQDCYSTVPTFRIDESAKTATLTARITLPPDRYSDFGGNSEVLPNNDLEYDLAGAADGATFYEVRQDSAHTPVWSLYTNGLYAYRASRIPSLYPGVQWP